MLREPPLPESWRPWFRSGARAATSSAVVPDRKTEPGSPDLPERDALMDAMTRLVVAKGGVQGLTPDAVARSAGLEAPAFHDHFDGVQGCYLDLYDRTVGELRAAMAEAAGVASWAYGREAWRQQLDGAIGAALSYLSGREELAEAVVVHVADAGPQALHRREAMLARFVRELEGARAAHGHPAPPMASEVLVRGVHQLVFARAVRGEIGYLRLLLDDLAYLWR